jgi:hypothetical protein
MQGNALTGMLRHTRYLRAKPDKYHAAMLHSIRSSQFRNRYSNDFSVGRLVFDRMIVFGANVD